MDFVGDHFDSTAYLTDIAADEGVNVEDDEEFEDWFDTDHAANFSTDAAQFIVEKLIDSLK